MELGPVSESGFNKLVVRIETHVCKTVNHPTQSFWFHNMLRIGIMNLKANLKALRPNIHLSHNGEIVVF